MINFDSLGTHIGVDFKDPSLLRMACTHRSYLNENRGSGMEHNERLEFLGDAVLELVVTSFLYRKYPKKQEGDLTAFRSAIVNTVSLTKVAERIGLGDYMLLSRGEAKDMGRARAVIIANAVEALIGAIYLDQDYNAAAQFIADHILNVIDIENIIKNKTWMDAKSRFQEVAQEKANVTPTYKTLKEVGPDHDKQFTLGVFLKDVQVATGSGPSKQEAEQRAAEKGLEVKGW